MEDIAPGLLEKIRTLFLELLGDDKPGADTYAAAGDYAERVGDALAAAFQTHLTGDALPDGRMYWNIADRVVRLLLEEDWRLCAGAAAEVQRTLNKAAGIGLAAQAPEPDKGRINGILNEICAVQRYEDKAWMLNESVRTFSRAAVDETLRRNAEFQSKAGLRPRIVRTAEHGCCKWCSALAGVYDYPGVPDDVYRRHANCRCSVEYDPGGGKRQDVWTKRWTDERERDILERRKNIGLLSESGRRYEQDIIIGRSAGAKAKNYNVMDLSTGEIYHFVEGSRIQNIEVFAGKGNRVPFRNAEKYAERYGGNPDDWQHTKGFGLLETSDGDREAEVHWVQCQGVGKHEFFVKRWLD